MVRRKYVGVALLSIIILDILCPCWSQFLHGPQRNPVDTIKNFRNIPSIPRLGGNGQLGNFQRNILSQQRKLRFQRRQFNQRLFDRRDADGGDSDTAGNGAMSQFPNTGFCKDGWTAASLNGVAICIRVNSDPSTWEDAQEKCRQDYSFLFKMEVPITVQSKPVQDYLLSLGIKNVWTGLHSEHGRLVWDDISPNLVSGQSRYASTPWNWDRNFTNQDKFCGELDIQDKSHVIETRRMRRSTEHRQKRAPNDRQTMQQFGRFLPRGAPLPTVSSKEIVENPFRNGQKEFSQPSYEDRLKALSNAQRMFNLANNAGQHTFYRGTNSQRALIRQQFPSLGMQSSFGENPQRNVRPVNNQQYINLLNMLRSGAGHPQSDNMNSNMNTAAQNFGIEMGTTELPPDDVDKNKDKIFGDLFNKPKQNEDDDNKNKMENIQQQMLPTTSSFDNNDGKIKIDPTMNPIFAELNKNIKDDNKNVKTSKGITEQTATHILEKILSDDTHKTQLDGGKNKFSNDKLNFIRAEIGSSDNLQTNNKMLDNFQLKYIKNSNDKLDDYKAEQNKPPESKEIDISAPKPRGSGLFINPNPDDSLTDPQKLGSREDSSIALQTDGKPVDVMLDTNGDVITEVGGKSSKEADKDQLLLPVNLHPEFEVVKDRNTNSKSIDNLNQIDAAIAEIDKALLDDENASPVEPSVENKEVFGKPVNIPTPSVKSNKPDDTAENEKRNIEIPNDEGDALLKVLESIEGSVDGNDKGEASIDDLRRQLERNLQPEIKQVEETKSTTTDKTKLNPVLNSGLLIHPVEPKQNQNDNINEQNKNEESLIGNMLYKPNIGEQTGVQNILDNLKQMSESTPSGVLDEDFLPGSVVQSVMTNEGGGTTIGMIPTSIRPGIVNVGVDTPMSQTVAIVAEDSSDSIQTEEQTGSLSEGKSISSNDALNVAPEGFVIQGDDPNSSQIISENKNLANVPPTTNVNDGLIDRTEKVQSDIQTSFTPPTSQDNSTARVTTLAVKNGADNFQSDEVTLLKDNQKVLDAKANEHEFKQMKNDEAKKSDDEDLVTVPPTVKQVILEPDVSIPEDVGTLLSETTIVTSNPDSIPSPTLLALGSPDTTETDTQNVETAMVVGGESSTEEIVRQLPDQSDGVNQEAMASDNTKIISKLVENLGDEVDESMRDKLLATKDVTEQKPEIIGDSSDLISALKDLSKDIFEEKKNVIHEAMENMSESISEAEPLSTATPENISDLQSETGSPEKSIKENINPFETLKDMAENVHDATSDVNSGVENISDNVNDIQVKPIEMVDAVKDTFDEIVDANPIRSPIIRGTEVPNAELSVGSLHGDISKISPEEESDIGNLSEFIDDNLPIPDDNVLLNILENANRSNDKTEETTEAGIFEDKYASNVESDVKEDVVDNHSDIVGDEKEKNALPTNKVVESLKEALDENKNNVLENIPVDDTIISEEGGEILVEPAQSDGEVSKDIDNFIDQNLASNKQPDDIIEPFTENIKTSEEQNDGIQTSIENTQSDGGQNDGEELTIANIKSSEPQNDVTEPSTEKIQSSNVNKGVLEQSIDTIQPTVENFQSSEEQNDIIVPSIGNIKKSEETNGLVDVSNINDMIEDVVEKVQELGEASNSVDPNADSVNESLDVSSEMVEPIVDENDKFSEEPSLDQQGELSEEVNEIIAPTIDGVGEVSKESSEINDTLLEKVIKFGKENTDIIAPSMEEVGEFSEEVNDILAPSSEEVGEFTEEVNDITNPVIDSESTSSEENTGNTTPVIKSQGDFDKKIKIINDNSEGESSEEENGLLKPTVNVEFNNDRINVVKPIVQSNSDTSSEELSSTSVPVTKGSNRMKVDLVDDSSEEQSNFTFLHSNNFDIAVDETENTAKEILSSEEFFEESQIIDPSLNDVSVETTNDTGSLDSDSAENFTNIFDQTDDILVSEAAAQDDIVHLKESRDLEARKTAEDMLEEYEEMVPPEDVVVHIPQVQTTPSPDQKRLIMRLGGCEKPKPYVCYTQPVKIDTEVSVCGNGWYGNVFVDKCYRYISQPMTFTYAESICAREGGNLAVADSNFLRRFILTSVTLARLQSNIQNTIVNVWIHSDTGSSNCRLLNNLGIQNVNCQTVAEAVCERPKQSKSPEISLTDRDSSEHDIEYVQPEIKQFSITNTDNKLECPLTNEITELPIIWYKDGVPLPPKVTKSSDTVLFPALNEVSVSPTSDLHLSSELIPQISAGVSNNTLAILQGKYWCEVWTASSFRRLESKPTLVRYSDVMTFVGTIHIHQLPLFDLTMFNMIHEPSQPIADIIKDIQIVYESTVPDIKAVVPDVMKIKVLPNSIERVSQTLKFYAYVTMTTPYTMATERSVNLLMSRELRENLQNTSFVLSLPGKTPVHLIRSIKFFSTVACPMSRLKDEETKLIATFPGSATGLEVNSVETCDGEVAGRAKCEGDFETGAHWTNIRVFKTCNDEANSEDSTSSDDDDPTVMEQSSLEDRLKELAEANVEDDNVENVIEETTEIIETAGEITAEYVDYVADIVDKTAEIHHATQETSKNIVKTVDRLLNVDDDEMKKTKRANSIIKSLEKVAENMDLNVYGQFRIVTPNVALEVWDLKHQAQPVIGLAAKEDQKHDIFEDSHIITLYNRSQIFLDDVNAAIELPPELVNEVMTDSKSRLYMMVYRHGRLFQTMTQAQSSLQQNQEAQFVDDSGLLNSFVISASIGGRKIEHLDQHVKAIFKPLKDVGDKEKTCAHWDFSLNGNRGGWSARGCTYNGTINGRDVCLCNHLTNFAVLIDFYGQAEPIPEEHEISLSIISLIGLSLSILGLSLTIISYAFFKKLRRGRAQQTLFNLALSMLCSWVVFLTGIKQTHSYYGCIIVAALLHYFILASFMWMLMEAFLQYLTFVKVLGTYVTRYTLKTVIIAWGLPLIPVISVSSIDYTLYSGGSRYCWMSLTAFYYSFAIPVGLIILCNLIVFVITVVSIFRRPTGLRTNQSKSKMAMANLQAAITSFVLLGLTWFLGYLAISDARLPFQYAFTILNSLQGFFIFILFVIRKKRVRDQWLILCCCKTPEQEKALRSLSASGSIPSTGSGRSSYSGRSERSDSTRTTTSFVNDSYDSLFFPFKSSRSTLYHREKSNSVSSE